jgi:uncharacterized membrane protein YkoI
MRPRPKLIITGAAVAAIALAGAVGAAANAYDEAPDDGTEESDVPITGPDLELATEAALAHLGEGKVTETEVEDEESYYEVEVRLPDGRQIDVQLDEAFDVVDVEGD